MTDTFTEAAEADLEAARENLGVIDQIIAEGKALTVRRFADAADAVALAERRVDVAHRVDAARAEEARMAEVRAIGAQLTDGSIAQAQVDAVTAWHAAVDALEVFARAQEAHDTAVEAAVRRLHALAGQHADADGMRVSSGKLTVGLPEGWTVTRSPGDVSARVDGARIVARWIAGDALLLAAATAAERAELPRHHRQGLHGAHPRTVALFLPTEED